MVDCTRLKDLAAKVDVMFTIMEQMEEQLLVAMDKRKEWMNLMEQTLHTMSKSLKSL